MLWFDKNAHGVVYSDRRVEPPGVDVKRPNFNVTPDVLHDFRVMPYQDAVFRLVVFDPPHKFKLSPRSHLGIRYGSLDPDVWQDIIREGFDECWRVLKPGGTLVFKWAESSLKVREVLEVLPMSPMFGHTTGKTGGTKWMLFYKPAELTDTSSSEPRSQ